jgi:hypothetical protein
VGLLTRLPAPSSAPPGQCPEFTRKFVADSDSSLLVWVYIASVSAVGTLCALAFLFSLYWHDKDVSLKVALAKHDGAWWQRQLVLGLAAVHQSSVSSPHISGELVPAPARSRARALFPS